ncbi:MAG: hypothetical protein QM786_04155 [Breznakibacter sp.]
MNRIKRPSLIFIVWLFASVVYGQAFKPNAEVALQHFKAKEFDKALEHYARLIDQFGKDPKYNFYLGVCLVETNRQIPLATRSLRFAALRNFNKETFFYLGRAYQLGYEFEEALANYAKFVKFPAVDETLKDRADGYMAECRTGMGMTPKIFSINVIAADTADAPSILEYYSFSPEMGKLMRNSDFFESGIDPNGILFVTERGDRVFYVSNTNGSSDIFKMEKLIDGWSKSSSIGSAINTVSEERYPVILTDGATLYFSSNRPGGLGGYDIYKATYNPDTKEFGEVVNMGIPFNSPMDDFFFVPDEFARKAKFTSNRATTGDKLVVYSLQWDETVVKNNVTDINQVKEAAQLPVNVDLATQVPDNVAVGKKNGIKKAANSFSFPVADTLEYTSYEHFRSNDALAEFKKGRMLELKKDSLGLLMREKRSRYATTNSDTERNAMVNEILRLEKETYSIDNAVGNYYFNAQRLEQDKITLLVRSGQYAVQDGTKVVPNNSFTFDVSEVPHDITLYSPDEFGRQLQALQGIYPQLFGESKIYQLRQADSLYVWGNILNIESARLLERASKTGTTPEVAIPNPFSKHQTEEQPGSDQLVKQSREVKAKALGLYHKSLDIKYSIYKTKYDEIRQLSDLYPAIQKYNNESYAFSKEAGDIEENAQLSLNPEAYEKAGTLKRKAVETQEKGLFTYLELLEKGEKPVGNKKISDGYALPSYSEMHKSDAPVAPVVPVGQSKKQAEQIPQSPLQETKTPVATAGEPAKGTAKVVYKIQIGAFKNKPNDAALRLLPDITTETLPESGVTKYFSGLYGTYDQAAANLQAVRDGGFPGAFVVAFMNGKQVSLQQARDAGKK